MRVSLQFLGCKVNQAEITDLEQELLNYGHEIVGLEGSPDICVVNTCTVTAKSDRHSRHLIRKAAKTGARIVVTGCYSQLNRDSVARMANVDAVYSNTDKDNIIRYLEGNVKVSDYVISDGFRRRYNLKVQDGCDHSCSYCLVWKARGKSRSLGLDQILDKAKMAVEAGYKEIVLTGVHLGLWGYDLKGKLRFSDLVKALLDNTNIPRIRLSSLEVGEISPEIIKILSDSRVCSHLHVPLQSGDSAVLRSMRRQYDRETYRERIIEIMAGQNGLSLGTDIIAGYPNESENAFENTLSLLAELPFSYAHVFPYSSRPGTLATKERDIVGGAKRKERASLLRELASWKKSVYVESQIGRRLEMLFETRLDNGLWVGTSDNYLKVQCSSSKNLRGTLCLVDISDLREGVLRGNIVKSL